MEVKVTAIERVEVKAGSPAQINGIFRALRNTGWKVTYHSEAELSVKAEREYSVGDVRSTAAEVNEVLGMVPERPAPG